MRAMVLDRNGGPEVLRMGEVERPSPGRGQVLIRLSHAGVNPADWKTREGWLSMFFDYRFPFVLGFDGAGWVEEVGEDVLGMAPGDRVVTLSNQGRGERGTYAEFVVSDAERTVRLPELVPFDRAAAIPIAGVTAMEVLFDAANLQRGQTVLINGGAGGTGSYAIRLAVRAGARVAATSGPQNLGYLEALGVERAIDYRRETVADAVRDWAPEGVDVVVDTVGQGTLLKAAHWVKAGGIVVPITTIIPNEPVHELVEGVRIVPTTSTYPNQPRQLRALAAMLGEGVFDDVAITTFALEQSAEAHRRIEEGHVRGKIVLKIAT